MSKLELLTQNLWQNYTARNPEAQKIQDLFTGLGEQVHNDHIAMRTFNRGPFSNKAMVSFFEDYDYKVSGDYFFATKKLDAVHLENEDPLQPKIFLSELKVEDFSQSLQDTVDQLISEVSQLSFTDILGKPRPWSASFAKYQELKEESEYCAWLYAHGLQVNHFTVFVNALKTFQDLPALNTWLPVSYTHLTLPTKA